MHDAVAAMQRRRHFDAAALFALLISLMPSLMMAHVACRTADDMLPLLMPDAVYTPRHAMLPDYFFWRAASVICRCRWLFRCFMPLGADAAALAFRRR